MGYFFGFFLFAACVSALAATDFVALLVAFELSSFDAVLATRLEVFSFRAVPVPPGR